MQGNAESTALYSVHPRNQNEDSNNIASNSTLASHPAVVNAHLVAPSPSMALSTRSSWLPILESESNQLVLYHPTSHALTITPASLLPVRRMLYGRAVPEGISPSNSQLAPISNRSRSLNNARLADNDDVLASAGQKTCPWCSRPYPADPIDHLNEPKNHEYHGGYARDGFSRRAPNYFKLLEQANHQAQSRPVSPPLLPDSHSNSRIRLAEMESPVTPGTPERTTASLDDRQTPKPVLNTGIGRGGVELPTPGTPKQRFGESSMAQGYFAAFFKEERRLGMGANGSVYLCQVCIPIYP